EPSSRGESSRAEAAQASSLERVRDAGHERRFGSDDRQVDALAACEVHERCNVVGRDCHIRNARLQCSAGVAGCDVDLLDAWRLRSLPCERMLTTAAA